MPFTIHWHTEAFLIISILFFGWIYAIYTGPLRHTIAPQEPFPTKKACLFHFTLILTYLTVGSPLDQIGEDFLFSVHMIQHMILIYLLPPLFILATPTWIFDNLFQHNWIRKIVRVFTHPVFAGGAFSLVYSIWHIPVLYESTLQNKLIHIFEHWTMYITALPMWWPIMSPSKILPPIGYGSRMLYVIALMICQIPVFLALCFSGEILYPTYEFAPRLIAIDPLQDQILGGVIMKALSMIISFFIFACSFYFWYQKDTHPDPVKDSFHA